jgi:hypothetical protein
MSSTLVLSPQQAAVAHGRAVPAHTDTSSGQWHGALRIDRRLNGPRHAANGGFAAGSIARRIDADTVTVTLHRAVPLARVLDVVTDGRGGAVVSRGRRLVATARPGRLSDRATPVAPTYGQALRARDAHPLAGVRHPLSDCVVCGPHRPDGMHVTPGFVPGRPHLLAAPWEVGARDAVGGMAPFAAVWAAMDCTSYPADALRTRELCLLGTMTAKVERRPRVGERLTVFSWTREHHGRRYETSAVLLDGSGAVVARADATWIALRHQRLHALRMRARRRARAPY